VKRNPVFNPDSLCIIYTLRTVLQPHRNGSHTLKLEDEDDEGKRVVKVHSKWNNIRKFTFFQFIYLYSAFHNLT